MAATPPTRSPAEDRDAIRGQIHAYCRSMDRMDRELGYAVWHADGEADYGEAIFRGSGHGFIDFVTEAHAGMLAHSHQVTTVLIELAGDRAASESYVTAALRQQGDDGLLQVTVRGRYLDRWSYRDGRWAIDRRIYLHDFDDVRPVVSTGAPTRGRRDRSDPSYDILRL